jgi:hypothetical protein
MMRRAVQELEFLTVSDNAQLKAEIIEAIELAKRLDLERLESLRHLRRLADSLIANPATPPEKIAEIEQQFESLRTMQDAVEQQFQQMSARYCEVDIDKLLSEGEADA